MIIIVLALMTEIPFAHADYGVMGFFEYFPPNMPSSGMRDWVRDDPAYRGITGADTNPILGREEGEIVFFGPYDAPGMAELDGAYELLFADGSSLVRWFDGGLFTCAMEFSRDGALTYMAVPE
ncbi:MAG: hypothetical protein ABII82_13245 [Verrucomicrobiota bacterium]